MDLGVNVVVRLSLHLSVLYGSKFIRVP